jgi:nucleoside-diphosphate-sugar epimerase
MPEKIVVTGVAGFIGSHLAERLLANGHEVVGVDSLTDYYDVRIKRANLEPLRSQPKFRFVEDSINRLDLGRLVDGANYVFHQAAQPGVRASWGQKFEEYIDSNVRATQALCEAVKNRPIKRFVYASSSSVYGETTQLPMGESHPTRPVSPYGVTKLDAENMCRNYGLPVLCLRYFTVYGPRQRPDMAFHRFIRAGLSGAPLEVYGNGSQTRDFTFVDDIVGANLAAMEYGGDERVLNVGGGSRVSLSRILDVIGGLINRELDVRYQDRQRGDVTHTFADIALARRELGYAPATELDEGVAREIEWVQSVYDRLNGPTG